MLLSLMMNTDAKEKQLKDVSLIESDQDQSEIVNKSVCQILDHEKPDQVNLGP